MRLIDADELKKAMWEAKGHYPAFSDVTLQSIYKVIDNAPIVFCCEACKNKGNERECVNCHDYSNFIQYEKRPQGEWIEELKSDQELIEKIRNIVWNNNLYDGYKICELRNLLAPYKGGGKE